MRYDTIQIYFFTLSKLTATIYEDPSIDYTVVNNDVDTRRYRHHIYANDTITKTTQPCS